MGTTLPPPERSGRRRDRLLLAAILIAVSPIFFYKLGNYSLVTGDEAFFQIAAARMVSTGDWLSIVYFDRELTFVLGSPLHFWARAALIAIGGDNGWTMRILAAFFGWMCVGATYVLARQALSRSGAVLAALFLATTYRFVVLHGARTGETDTIVTFLFLWIAHDFLRGLRTGSFLRHHVAWLLLLNVKLPLALLPLFFEGVHFLVSEEARPRFRRWAIALVAVAPVAAIWPAYNLIRDAPGFLWVIEHMWRRAVEEPGGRTGGPAYYAQVLLAGHFPYSLAAIAALVSWPRPDLASSRSFHLLLRIAILSIFLFFSLVRKSYPWYVHPMYPFLSILAAEWLVRRFRTIARVGSQLGFAGLLAAMAVLRCRPERQNPFEGRSFLPGRVSFALDESALLILAAIVVTLALVLRSRSRWARRALPAACIGALLALGVARMAGPVPYLDYRSPTEEFAEWLTDHRRRDKPIGFPIVLHFGRRYEHEYYFARDYLIEHAPPDREKSRPPIRSALRGLRSPPDEAPQGPR